MDRIVSIFWTISILKMLFSLPILIGAARSALASDRAIAKGQRKDDWLGCIVIALAFLLNVDHPGSVDGNAMLDDATRSLLSGYVYVIGTMVMAWLLRRTSERLKSMHRS